MKTQRYSFFVLAVTGLALVGIAGCARRSVAVDPGAGDKPRLGGISVVQDDKPGSTERFQFPADKGGKLLDETLRPPQKLADEAAAASQPKRLKAPPAVEQPSVALTMPALPMARPGLVPKAAPLRPHVLPEEAPLTAYRSDPARVNIQHLPTGAPVRLATVDVNLPPPLPILANPGIDRAPLDDPTSEDSLKNALAAVPPIRSNPAPFVRLILPDPFENAQTVRLRALPPEEQSPATGPVRPPKP
jgi:hypothetical protein